jgi:hypothetical protein
MSRREPTPEEKAYQEAADATFRAKAAERQKAEAEKQESNGGTSDD